MSDFKHWRFIHADKWPFDPIVMDGDREVFRDGRAAWSSSHKTLDDVLSGRGMGNPEEAATANQQQEADFRLAAKAPEMAELLERLLDLTVSYTHTPAHKEAREILTYIKGDA